MRRCMKLIFKILEYVEREKTNGNKLSIPEFYDYDDSVVNYHVRLCAQAGYIQIDQVSNFQVLTAKSIIELTWAGHQELERMREEGIGDG